MPRLVCGYTNVTNNIMHTPFAYNYYYSPYATACRQNPLLAKSPIE